MSGTLFVVATPIGNLEDITARALRVLREATLIAAEDTRRTGQLLARYAISTPTTSLHEHNEATKSRSLVARLVRGDDIALVSDAGTPTVSDPGQALVRAAIDAGIRIESIPGPNAAVATLAASGFPMDHFSFLGFPPIRSKDRTEWFLTLRRVGGIAVFYEAPHRIQTTLQDIVRELGDRPVVVGREVTKIHEEFVRGPISAAMERLKDPRGELTVVLDVGHTTEQPPVKAAGDSEIAIEFGRLTEEGRLGRRRIISELAKRFRLPANQIYESVERSKKLGR